MLDCSKERSAMNSELVHTGAQQTGAQSGTSAAWIVRAVLGLAVAFVCWIVVYSVVYGPQMKAEAEKRMAQEIAQENEAVCGKLGMQAGSQALATCAAELMQVRQRHEARLSRDFE
jgi:hypothetical protein